MITYYDDQGNEWTTDEPMSLQDQIKSNICASHIENKNHIGSLNDRAVTRIPSQHKYYIRTINKDLYDPANPINDYGEPQALKVSKGVFDYYIAYLKTKRYNLLTAARGEI